VRNWFQAFAFERVNVCRYAPGPELETQDQDYLFCEAQTLLATIEAVLKVGMVTVWP
jgi:hypothetical protein